MHQCIFTINMEKFFLHQATLLFKLNVKYHVSPRDLSYRGKFRFVSYRIVFTLMLITYQITVL